MTLKVESKSRKTHLDKKMHLSQQIIKCEGLAYLPRLRYFDAIQNFLDDLVRRYFFGLSFVGKGNSMSQNI